jgi:hypothetical protein
LLFTFQQCIRHLVNVIDKNSSPDILKNNKMLCTQGLKVDLSAKK